MKEKAVFDARLLFFFILLFSERCGGQGLRQQFTARVQSIKEKSRVRWSRGSGPKPAKGASVLREEKAMGYPVILQLRGRRAVVVGGGNVAARKIHGLLEAGADVVVIAPEAAPDIEALAAKEAIVWKRKRFDPNDLAGAFLVIAATSDREVNEAVARAAEPGQLLNIVDDPERCDFHVPAVIRRGPLMISVSTGGASPALARRIRRELEEQYGDKYGPYLEFLRQARDMVLREVADAEGRKRLFRALAADSFRQSGRWEEEFTRLLAKEKERNKEGERGR